MPKRKNNVDFINICNRLRQDSKKEQGISKYVLAKTLVATYIEDDKNKLLQLKAESQRENFFEYQGYNIATTAVILTFYALFFTIIEAVLPNLVHVYGLLFVVIDTTWLLLLLWFERKYRSVRDWRTFIQVAIEDFEQFYGEHKELGYERAVCEWKQEGSTREI